MSSIPKILIPFEIHITADKSIHETARQIGFKTISVDLLAPDLSLLRTEHMTSHVQKFESYIECCQFVIKSSEKLHEAGSKLVRIKIECPSYVHTLEETSIYIESHWHTAMHTPSFPKDIKHPISRSQHKPNLLSTARTYDKSKYAEWKNKSWGTKQIVELCLFDSFVEEDFDWFKLYE